MLIRYRGRFVGVEVKYADAPTLTPSMRNAFADLELQRLIVVYPGTQRYRLTRGIEVMPLAECLGEPGDQVAARGLAARPAHHPER